jgi:type VI secretion system ImpM family protein
MLGIGASARAWCWRAAGKHPAAGDFVDVGQATPLTDALADWMTRGYFELQRTGRIPSALCSWRFWMQGGRKERCVCGLIRDSSDRIGRPFPFLIAGEGSWEGWEQRWVDLPALLAGCWRRLERAASQRYDDLPALTTEVAALGMPDEINGCAPASGPAGASPASGTGELIGRLHGSGRLIVALDDAQDPDPMLAALKIYRELACCGATVPKAGFIGGAGRQVFLALMMQPLGIDAFEMLWGI